MFWELPIGRRHFRVAGPCGRGRAAGQFSVWLVRELRGLAVALPMAPEYPLVAFAEVIRDTDAGTRIRGRHASTPSAACAAMAWSRNRSAACRSAKSKIGV